ncbi:hypothetical protein HRR83_000069 [Exophiala dermatitidis]|uniref:WIBG Mago-binding domain-containing protein n=2 Tax=Exophiala dermatitidis TaxID=5970 RepID=H6C882_EXODN|nr:uncharacterized protein HMPREF1120_08275 [Exophiala dermatitidis NIH/UT8656]KAJ4523422.1 hypothetical protein HRR73_002603 [Exophiala dermatitidis]EHY60309.1 hypothetical protein HMPREF1120_08275 [Exophiala dermatitidis NIH/UT8656]KAJ4524472.1 hypothetical protein HRR75_000060 [Exophiala dermatitidis]KAJ4527318.1 hypothetical protein HRR74_000070 [Exophiala dermatitidis]KAJ4530873.1 hypothetical protein HRR76_008565 [Exophiala dermatitidis]
MSKKVSKAGIETTPDGSSYIPSSKRADGSTRKEIRVRPGYRPPEDVETYKNRSAEAWKNRGQGGVPGAEPVQVTDDTATNSRNAKRREAARKKKDSEEDMQEQQLATAMQNAGISDKTKENWRDPSTKSAPVAAATGEEVDVQKKIRNQLKKLKAIRELREKRAAGEKLSHDQIMKIGKEGELLRDLKKLGYDGPEVQAEAANDATT